MLQQRNISSYLNERQKIPPSPRLALIPRCPLYSAESIEQLKYLCEFEKFAKPIGHVYTEAR